MRDAPPSLIAYLLEKKPVIKCDLFTFSFQNGDVLNLTNYTRDVTYQNVVYRGTSGYPVMSRTNYEVKNTPEVPQMVVTLYSNGQDYNSQNIKLMIHNGYFDGCHVLLQKLYMQPQSLFQLGTIQIFGGRTGQIELNENGAKITFKGDNVRLEQNFPRNIYNTGCIHSLYDASCKANRASFTFEGVVATANAIALTWSAVPAGSTPASFTRGYVTFTSGAADAETRTIQTNVGTTGISYNYPLYTVPAPGDTFTITYGCQKTMAYCTDVFDNLHNYRGFPFIPPPETAF